MSAWQFGRRVKKTAYFAGEHTTMYTELSYQFSLTLTFQGEFLPGRLEFPNKRFFELESDEFELQFEYFKVASNLIRVNPSQQQVTIIEASE